MKTMYLVFSVIFILILGSCSQKPIKNESISDYITIEKGEKAKIKWDFSNANKVRVDGFDIDLNTNDSLEVSPETTSLYYIKAYNDKLDSLSVSSNVVVNNNDAVQNNSSSHETDISGQRGPVSLKQLKLEPSYKYSEFLAGTLEATKLTEPNELKIMNTFYNTVDNSITLKAILLDEFGNYLSGYSNLNETFKWHTELKCANQVQNPVFIHSIENKPNKNLKLDIAINFDNSSAQFSSSDVLKNIEDFMNYLSPECNVMFSTFNQGHSLQFALSPAEKALWEFRNLELIEPSGLNAIYKSTYLTLDMMNKGYHPNKICIVITYNSDNSSIIYTADDVYNISRKTAVPVYIIGIGDAIDTYALRNLSTSTGGKFYHLLKEDLNKLQNVLTEIVISQNSNYEMSFSLNHFKDCNTLDSKLEFETPEKKLLEKFKIEKNPEFRNMKYQALANFEYRDANIHNDYLEVLNSLVYVMKKNPDQPILLIGHSSNEGSEIENLKFSTDRAIKIKEYLISQGVSASQIEIKGEGHHKPLYYFQENNWEQKYNRRVELKWLDPSVKPYEIATEVLQSEELATKAVDFWESKGYRAYYDRYVLNNQTQYQIRLWNFSTKDEALKTANEINKKYKKKVLVE